LNASTRHDIVEVEFLSGIKGTRRFPIPGSKGYFFDAGSNKRCKMSREHAAVLVSKFGPTVFRTKEIDIVDNE